MNTEYLGDFEYLTLQDLASEGFNVSEPDRVRKLIKRVSKILNSVTDLIFWPSYVYQEVNGQDLSTIELNDGMPIQRVDDITLDFDRLSMASVARDASIDRFLSPRNLLGTRSLTSDEFIIQGTTRRRIELIRPGISLVNARDLVAVFPRGVRNIKMTLYCGWLEQRKDVRTSLTADLAGGVQSIALADVSKLVAGDVLVAVNPAADWNDPFKIETFEILTVDYVGKIVTFEILRARPNVIPSGSPISCFGKVPEVIKMAMMSIFKQYQKKLAVSDGTGTNQGKLKREQIDNYEYEFFTSEKLISILTGNVLLDDLLRQFTQQITIGVI